MDDQPKIKTLDEYLAEKAQKHPEAAVEVRKANDGQEAFEGAQKLVRTEEDFYPTKSEKKSRAKAKKNKVVYVEIEQRFNEEQKKGRKPPSARQRPVNVEDFPELSAI